MNNGHYGNKNYGNHGKWKDYNKKLDESRKISIGAVGTIGTIENGKTSLRNLMKVEKYL